MLDVVQCISSTWQTDRWQKHYPYHVVFGLRLRVINFHDLTAPSQVWCRLAHKWPRNNGTYAATEIIDCIALAKQGDNVLGSVRPSADFHVWIYCGIHILCICSPSLSKTGLMLAHIFFFFKWSTSPPPWSVSRLGPEPRPRWHATIFYTSTDQEN